MWWCYQCGKQYMWRDSLKKHLRVECGKDPTFECPICGRKFKHKHLPRLTVKNIENLQYKRRPVIHKCTRCGKGYQLETSLRRHQRLECGVEPRQSCPICGKKFMHRFKMTHHLASCRRKRDYYGSI
ncbi:longitudinals lacking protein, isoforms N/O/W/X/Y-like [Osmia lignaria lignaria]|uniref:longitudinals lacking protein, isoforms N/O/W/X/Y-like n=1 Tax=Osmia lignaria lignaria TaxID=1437193 RepID=UPI00402B373A